MDNRTIYRLPTYALRRHLVMQEGKNAKKQLWKQLRFLNVLFSITFYHLQVSASAKTPTKKAESSSDDSSDDSSDESDEEKPAVKTQVRVWKKFVVKFSFILHVKF